MLIVLIGAYFAYQYWDTETAGEEGQVLDDGENLLAPREAPPGYKEYRNTRYRFSLFYPEEMEVNTHDEGGSAMTVTFEDPAGEKGFQVFVVRYLEPEVTEERFLKDVPSGVREGQQTVTIDDAPGVSFYSHHAALGDTAEIWFLHRGYLYEVTTLRPWAPWLSDIMLEWRFLIK